MNADAHPCRTAALRLYPAVTSQIGRLGRRGEVLEGIWAGKGTKEIAAQLGISPKTVEFHRAKLYELFGVNDLVSLCRRAIAVGLINVDGDSQKVTKATKRVGP
jgi:DNA-binding CsgD family transcriptional regulator